LAGVTAVLLWASAASWITAAKGVPPFLYYGIETLIGFFIMAGKWRYLRLNPLPEFRATPLWYYLIGIMGIGLQGAAWVAAIQTAPPLEAILFIYQWPMLVIVFTTLATGGRLGLHHGLAIVLGLSGLVTLLVGRGLDFGSFHLLPGHFWGLVAALTWSLFSAAAARRKDIGPNVVGAIMLLSSVVNLSIWLAMGAELPPLQGLIICVIASFVIMPGYILWDYGMKLGNTRIIGICSFMIPVLSTIILVLLGQAAFTLYLLPALLLVMAGIAAARYGEAWLKRAAPAQ